MIADISQPNPEWKDAPFSCCGIADTDTIESMVAFYTKKYGKIAVEKTPFDFWHLWRFKMWQVDP